MNSGCRQPSRSESRANADSTTSTARSRVGPACLCTAILIATLAVAQAHAGSLAVVVHPEVPVDDLSFAEFRKIILGDRQHWVSGQPVTLIVRAPVAEERTILLEQVYRMSEAQFRQFWVAKVFRAEASEAPRVVLSNSEAVDLVSLIDGAIAVINVDDVPDGLKVLRIDGKLPGEDGYRFE